MNNIIQTLKDETRKAEMSFVSMIDSNPNFRVAAEKNIEAMKQIYNILDNQCAKVKNSSKRSGSKTIFIGDDRIDVKTNKDVVETISQYIVANHYKDLCAKMSQMISSVTGKAFVSKNADDIENPTVIKVGRKTIYVDVYRMMTNNMMLFKKMLNILDLNNIRIENNVNAAIA